MKYVILGREVIHSSNSDVIIIPSYKNRLKYLTSDILNVYKILRTIFNESDEDITIITYNVTLSYSIPILFFKCKKILFLVDPIERKFASNKLNKFIWYCYNKMSILFASQYDECLNLVSNSWKDYFPKKRELTIHPLVFNDSVKVNKMKISSEVRIGYAGSITEFNGANIIIELCQLLPSNYIFHLCGNENIYTETLKNMQNVVYHGVVSKNKVQSVMRNCHILLNLRSDQNDYSLWLSKYAISFKLYEIIENGIPVICNMIPSINKDLHEFINFSSLDVHDVLKLIIEMTDTMNYPRYLRKANQGAIFIHSICNIENLKSNIKYFLNE